MKAEEIQCQDLPEIDNHIHVHQLAVRIGHFLLVYVHDGWHSRFLLIRVNTFHGVFRRVRLLTEQEYGSTEEHFISSSLWVDSVVEKSITEDTLLTTKPLQLG